MATVTTPTTTTSTSPASTSTAAGAGDSEKKPISEANKATEKRSWRAWSDWISLLLSLYLLFASIWTPDAPVLWFVPLGIIAAMSSLVALGSGSVPTFEWTQIFLGAVLIALPWLVGFTAATAAAWTAWIVGGGLIIFSVIAVITRPTSAS